MNTTETIKQARALGLNVYAPRPASDAQDTKTKLCAMKRAVSPRIENMHVTRTGVVIGRAHVPQQRPVHGESALVIQRALLAKEPRARYRQDLALWCCAVLAVAVIALIAQ